MKSHFQFSKNERNGIFFLILLIVVLQLIYWFVDFSQDEQLVVNSEIELLNRQIDSFSALQPVKKAFTYNPNFITEEKGYQLGLSLDEIDRLHRFRAIGKYVNTADEFQQVTQVSDSVLNTIKQDFRFPNFKPQKKGTKALLVKPKIAIVKEDLNSVSENELKAISGIGNALAARIIKFRTALGGFLVEDQLYDVYGLKPEVVNKVKERYSVFTKPTIERLNINEVSAYELSSLVYVKYSLAKKIVAYRDSVGTFESIDQLTKIEGFPTNKIERIRLYLLVD
ncbi:ComEA family DNA-binding protein [Spongiivirga citrea]|uniref:Helix-hairpin-helix domain-containing protein n=1 Tax=Spongiivirga citrea TaxID=1481457 RepID=A0A6M0CRE8_9FLAO|nr:helix-hairpin-helix domain-containing protein [Spongiivirga citrea]NER18439.1 helix-hairpin-helix domain-containing protein [Spongiivirga citrea]